jgi:hypothetical protein
VLITKVLLKNFFLLNNILCVKDLFTQSNIKKLGVHHDHGGDAVPLGSERNIRDISYYAAVG